MNPEVEAWIENKISELQELIDDERRRIEVRDGPGDGMFAGMEKSTTEIVWKAKIQVLRELQDLGL